MKGRLLYRAITGFLRFVSIVLIAISMSLALLLIAQRVFTPFQVVTGDSMSPQMEAGDAIVLKDLEPNEIEVGQIIVFNNPLEKSEYVIHRVIAIEDAGTVMYFTTKGDNNTEPDPEKIPTGQVVGGIAVRLPGFGSFLDFLSTPKGYISCIGLPAAMSLILVAVVALIEKLFHMKTARRDGPHPQATAQ